MRSDDVDQVRAALARTPGDLTPHRVAAALRAHGRPVGDESVLAIHAELRRDVSGAGVLEPLLRRPGTTDVLVNGAGQVWLDQGQGLELSEVTFPDESAVRRLAQRLAAGVGRRLDDATPFVDLRLADGTRFHAVLAPVARPGTLLSLRVPPTRAFTLADLERVGSLSAEGVRVLRALVGTRVSFLVTGGTGTGKTTLLSTLLSEVDPAERIVLVEDAGELRPEHPHVVALEARPPNVEGAGEVSLRDLVRQALRMRPDRLVVGEVRGPEVTDLLAALNTGHEGGCGTVHANGVTDLPARLEALAATAGMGREATHAQVGAALGAVVHLVRDPDGLRRVGAVGVPVVRGRGTVEVRVALEWPRGAPVRLGPGAERLEQVLAHGVGRG